MDNDAYEKLRHTQALFRQACNLLVEIVCEDSDRKQRLWQRYNLHHVGYHRVREAVPQLGAQLTCNAVRVVSAAYKSLLTNNPKYVKDKKLALPKIVFKNVGIHLDARTLSFSKDRTSATVFTTQKRVNVRLCPGAFQQEILSGGQWRECELVYKRKRDSSQGQWQLHIVVTRDIELPDLRNLLMTHRCQLGKSLTFALDQETLSYTDLIPNENQWIRYFWDYESISYVH